MWKEGETISGEGGKGQNFMSSLSSAAPIKFSSLSRLLMPWHACWALDHTCLLLWACVTCAWAAWVGRLRGKFCVPKHFSILGSERAYFTYSLPPFYLFVYLPSGAGHFLLCTASQTGVAWHVCLHSSTIPMMVRHYSTGSGMVGIG